MNIRFLFARFIKKLHLPAVRNSKISKKAKVCSGSQITNSLIGDYSYVGNFSTLNHTEVGKFCSIADKCIIGGASHPIDWVSTSPVFHQGRNVLKVNFSEHIYKPYKNTIIENDVWIGAGVYIKSGVTIANGAVVGMGAIVTKDIGPYEIWGGNPARLIKKRFDELTIQKLNSVKWWEQEDELFKNAETFNDIKEFLTKGL